MLLLKALFLIVLQSHRGRAPGVTSVAMNSRGKVPQLRRPCFWLLFSGSWFVRTWSDGPSKTWEKNWSFLGNHDLPKVLIQGRRNTYFGLGYQLSKSRGEPSQVIEANGPTSKKITLHARSKRGECRRIYSCTLHNHVLNIN